MLVSSPEVTGLEQVSIIIMMYRLLTNYHIVGIFVGTKFCKYAFFALEYIFTVLIFMLAQCSNCPVHSFTCPSSSILYQTLAVSVQPKLQLDCSVNFYLQLWTIVEWTGPSWFEASLFQRVSIWEPLCIIASTQCGWCSQMQYPWSL